MCSRLKQQLDEFAGVLPLLQAVANKALEKRYGTDRGDSPGKIVLRSSVAVACGR